MPPPTDLTVRFRVAGRVQGVFFRASTQALANELGLAGYARNLSDGRVEVMAAGAAEAIDELHAWLHRGPPQARVDTVEREPVDAGDAVDFSGTFEVRR